MKSVTKLLFFFFSISCCSTVSSAEGLREAVLRDAALDAGLVPARDTHILSDDALVSVGQKLFESRILSFNNDTACASCHLDQFGSADGLPNSIGTEGEGVGAMRIVNGGDIVPRNALPFWGRGGVGFDVFFWDGKVDNSTGKIVSQFGDQAPSKDPLIAAIHLPPVEIGEMVIDSRGNDPLQSETVETANEIYDMLAERIEKDPELGSALALARSVPRTSLKFIDVAEAIAAFVRVNFRVKSTKFHDFVFDRQQLSAEELEGGLLFYGRGGCSACHNGPYFSDMKFHAIPFSQIGFGKNGFGVDYGRFNVTLDESDRHAFRTPPLYNVAKTAPYSHSGSVPLLTDAIGVHVDPLLYVDPQKMSANDRTEFYNRLRLWSSTSLNGVVMTEREIAAIAAFLDTLSYDSDSPVKVVD
ncbi:His-Xaa-Ser system-associated MauG-like protein [Sulfitobacter pontiacus]|uniref:His-Xaa-Ser system-associated MauG-like protein n=1 Tax=Sulfitobacter pontiacus TaxID=60137 RepID=UPI00315A17FB